MADTSYSDMTAADNRGLAVSDVRLRADGSMEVGGRLHDGERIHYVLTPMSAAVTSAAVTYSSGYIGFPTQLIGVITARFEAPAFRPGVGCPAPLEPSSEGWALASLAPQLVEPAPREVTSPSGYVARPSPPPVAPRSRPSSKSPPRSKNQLAPVTKARQAGAGGSKQARTGSFNEQDHHHHDRRFVKAQYADTDFLL